MLDRVHQERRPSGQAPGARHLQSPAFPEAHDAFYSRPDFAPRLGLRRVWACLVHYQRLIAVFLLVGLAAGFTLFLAQAPLYRATLRIEVAAPAARVMRDLEVVTQAVDPRAIQSAIEKLKSRGVIQRAVAALDLANRPDFLFPPTRFSISRLLGLTASAHGKVTLSPGDARRRERGAITQIQANLSVALIRNTNILTLAYGDRDPQTAEAVVAQIARSYLDLRAEETSQTSHLARQFIENQVAAVKQRLQRSETELLTYARQQRIMAVSGGEESLVEQKIRAVNAGLADAINERLAAESRVQQIDAGHGNQLEEVLSNGAALGIRTRIADLRADYEQKLRTFKPDYPEMRMLKARIDELEKQHAALSDAVTTSLRRSHAEAVAREDQITAELAELEAELATYADKSIQYTILKREVDSQRAQHDSLIGKLNELDVGTELKMQNATILDEALAPAEPVTPQLGRSLAMSLLIAAGLAALAVAVLERLNNAFRTPAEVEAQLHLPVLSALPNTPAPLLEADLANAQSALGEAYRTLRTALQFGEGESLPRALLVTSAEPGEGKTTTAYKIAADFAALGRRVLLVDADLRRPSVHRRLNLANRAGLSDILSRKVARTAFPRLFQQAAPNLSVLTAGPATNASPVDLLSCSRTAILFGVFLRRYDLVVIDGPPVTGLSDAPILARLADATLMVVSARQVSRPCAWLALSRLRAAGANVVGIAMTKFRLSDAEDGYAYRYSPAAVALPKPAQPVLPKTAIRWDYFGDPYVPKPGLIGLWRAAADLQADFLVSLKQLRHRRAYR